MEMIEKAAAAVAREIDHIVIANDGDLEAIRACSQAIARAAIEALREPAGPPLDMAISALYRHYFGDGGFIGTEAAKEQIRLTHRALIEAILNPTPSASDTNSPPAQPIADRI